MNAVIDPRRLSGTVRAIPSKSEAHRALILAALSDKTTDILLSSVSDDVMRTADALRAIGAGMEYEDGVMRVTPICGVPESAVIDCGESGSTLRFMMPVCASLGIAAEFICRGRLASRPVGELRRAMEAHGVVFDGDLRMSGRLGAGEYELAGNVSLQYVTGLMLALGRLGEPSHIRLTTELESAPYVEMTRRMMNDFGCAAVADGDGFAIPGGGYASPGRYAVGGDWSAAAFWLCAGCAVDGLSPDSAQGDKRVADILREMGADVSVGQGCVKVGIDALRAVTLDMRDVPDLVPVIAVLCAAADGVSRIGGIRRLRFKESDRVEAVVGMIRSLGREASAGDDEIVIRGGALAGALADGCGDHRIVMAAAVASCFCTGRVVIRGAETVTKSYPGFWDDFAALGGKVEFTKDNVR